MGKIIETSRVGVSFWADKPHDFLIDQAKLSLVAELLVLLNQDGELILLLLSQELQLLDFLALHRQQLVLLHLLGSALLQYRLLLLLYEELGELQGVDDGVFLPPQLVDLDLVGQQILLLLVEEPELHDFVFAQVLDLDAVDVVVLEFLQDRAVPHGLNKLAVTYFRECEYTVSHSSNLFSDRALSSFSLFSNSLFSSSSFRQIWSSENRNMLFFRMLIDFLLSDCCILGSSLL